MSPARSRYSVTTLDPGASDVFTHGWLISPRSTALRASRPAPSMTDGLEVFVHDVMAAMTTWPWSTLNVSPSIVTSTAVSECSAITVPAATAGAEAGAAGGSWPGTLSAGGSEAGKVSATASSWELAMSSSASRPTRSASAARKESFAPCSATRSCGRLGPASEGTTSPRSSSRVSEYVGSSAFSSCQRPCSLA